MSLVTDKQKSDYRKLGFALVENVIPEPQLSTLRGNLTQLWQRAKKKQINPIRVYDDFPHVLGGVNVAGIEDAFFHAPMLKDWIVTSGLDRILAELTGWRGAELELARVHMNDRFKYQGFWHRDARVTETENSVVAIAYFQDEEGFRIMPSENKYSLASLPLGDEIQRRHFYGELEGEHSISAPAGSVFFMKSYLLHRGYNNKPRLHLHTRFIESDAYDVNAWTRYRNLEVASHDFASTSPVDRARTLISYCIPRKNRSSLFQP